MISDEQKDTFDEQYRPVSQASYQSKNKNPQVKMKQLIVMGNNKTKGVADRRSVV